MTACSRAFVCAAIVLSGGFVFAQNETALHVYSSNGVRIVLQELQPQIEAAIGRRLVFQFSTSRNLAERIAADEAFDVAILTPRLIDELVEQRKIAPESRSEFARVGIGVGSRRGTPVKPVGTLDELRQTFLEADSVAFGASGQSRRTNEASFEVLGISDEMQRKTRLTGPGEAPVLVAEGEIELVLTLVSELLREPGIQFLGPLPGEVQGYIDFAAGVGSGTADPDGARELIAFLATPAFVEVLGQHGLEPIGP